MLLSISNIRIAKRSWIIKAGTMGDIISRRRVRSNLTNPGLEHSADVCLDNGMAA